MKNTDNMEHCSIIDAACPYNFGCDVCRLNNDYEEAAEKSRKLTEIPKSEG